MSRVCACGQQKSAEARTCARCYHDRCILRRYPYRPLAVMLGGNSRHQATHLGLSKHAVNQMARRGLSPWQADKYAVAAGFHPSALWPSWFADALTDAEEVA